jgi:hypothetical protein
VKSDVQNQETPEEKVDVDVAIENKSVELHSFEKDATEDEQPHEVYSDQI